MSQTTSVSTQDATFLARDVQLKLTEEQIDQLASVQAGSVTDAELGRWYGVDNTRLIAQDSSAGSAAGLALPTTPSSVQGSIGTGLASLTGAAFDSTYLADVTSLKTMETVGGAAEISGGSNAVFQQIATASNGLVAEQLNDALHVQALMAGTTPVAIGGSMPFAGPAPAANGALNATDQAFMTTATQGNLTAEQEAGLDITGAPDLSVQTLGVWNRCENAQAQVNIAALATAEGYAPPTTITAAQAAQVTALGSLTGTAFETAYLADQVANDQVLGAAIKTELASGSDPALTTLASLILAPAAALLTQAIIETVQVGGGFTDTTLAPNTPVGAMVSTIAAQAGAGALTIGLASTAPASLSGASGVLLVNGAAAPVSIPGGYADVLDVAGAPVTLVAAASATNTIVGGTQGITYYGATGSGGTILLNGGSNLVLGTATGAGNATVVGSARGTNTIYAGGGQDQIASGTGTNLIGLGSGSNVVTAQGTDTLVESSGTDLVYGAGASQVVFGGTGRLTFVGGAGSATVVTGTAPTTLFGGSGGSINLFGAASGNLLIAGAGNETLEGGSATGANVFVAGAGSVALLGGAGNDTFVASSGAATMTGAGGSNLFAFVSGATKGGTDVITDFGASSGNRVLVTGYGTTNASVLATASVSGGSTTVTLADNTKVQFLGVSTLSSTSFL